MKRAYLLALFLWYTYVGILGGFSDYLAAADCFERGYPIEHVRASLEMARDQEGRNSGQRAFRVEKDLAQASKVI